MEIEPSPAPAPAPEQHPRRLAIASSLEKLPEQYTDLISGWLRHYRGREAAAAAVNAWLSAVRPDLITQGIQRGVAAWLAPLSEPGPDALPVWPLQDWKIEFEPLCTRRFINRARQGQPMFKQRGRGLCGADSRFIGLISAAVLCSAGLTEPDDPGAPSTDLDAFVLVFDHIHRHMHCIVEQQTSTIQDIERRRRAGHQNWLGRAPESPRRVSRQRDRAERIFDWALEQTWPIELQRDPPLSMVLRRQELRQVRRPLLEHILSHHTLPDPDLPLTLSSAHLAAPEQPGHAVEVFARDLLTLGLWCLKAGIDPGTEARLNRTLYALSATLLTSPPPGPGVTTAQLAAILESLPTG